MCLVLLLLLRARKYPVHKKRKHISYTKLTKISLEKVMFIKNFAENFKLFKITYARIYITIHIHVF